MKLCATLSKLIVNALEETNNQGLRYEVSARELLTKDIPEEGVTAKRYWFIDDKDSGLYIRSTQLQANPLLETVDILEQVRVHNTQHRHNHQRNYQDFKEACEQTGIGHWPLLENYYNENKRKDHQLLGLNNADLGQISITIVTKEEEHGIFLLTKFNKDV